MKSQHQRISDILNKARVGELARDEAVRQVRAILTRGHHPATARRIAENMVDEARTPYGIGRLLGRKSGNAPEAA